DLQPILDTIASDMAAEPERGQVASYIPELACIDPQQFGIAAALPDGRTLVAGDADVPFSIQSVSKVFTLSLALGRLGDDLWHRVGVEPSGQAFNSILQLEREAGIPRNPFINAGALVVTDTLLQGRKSKEVLAELLGFVRQAAGDDAIHIDPKVARSEADHGDRNLALAHFMAAHGNLRHPAAETCGTYFHQCAIAMSCRQLAQAGRFLVGGLSPDLVSPARARRILALMLTCGHYDASGDFAFRVGLPGKSGVGGGILLVAPGCASLAVWSPGLNRNGNSRLGTLAAERLAAETNWSVFD
ncbi:MAG: glutaminase, partial [Pseudomonadota bacterium]